MKQYRNKEADKPFASILPFALLTGLLAGYVVTAIGLFVLALLLLQFHLSEGAVEIGILALYVLSVFFCGFLVGKQMETRKFLWGLVAGLAYFLALFVLSVLIQKGIVQGGRELATIFLICAGGGMLGGMLS